MSKPDFNDMLHVKALNLAAELELPLIAVVNIFRVLSTAYFLGYEHGADQVLKSYDKHSGINPND